MLRGLKNKEVTAGTCQPHSQGLCRCQRHWKTWEREWVPVCRSYRVTKLPQMKYYPSLSVCLNEVLSSILITLEFN